MSVLYVKDWADVFRHAEFDRYTETHAFKFPAVRNSLSYRTLMADNKGRTAYCVFIGILRLVARGRTGGALTVKGQPMTEKDVAVETGIPAKQVAESIAYLRSPLIAWITDKQTSDTARTAGLNGEGSGTYSRGDHGGGTVNSRGDDGDRPGFARSGAPAAATCSAAMPAASKQQQGELCTMLLGLTYLKTQIFDKAAAAAIASNPRVSRMNIDWAMERMNTKAKSGKLPDNIGGYLRALIEREEVPPGWSKRWREQQLANVAAERAAGGAA